MAKRSGGFGGGMPGNYQNLLKQAQRMQNQMQAQQEKIRGQEFTATAGGGAVKIVMTGEKVVKEVVLDRDAVDPEDVETLQDMLVVAFNDAAKQIDDENEKAFGGMTGGMGLGF